LVFFFTWTKKKPRNPKKGTIKQGRGKETVHQNKTRREKGPDRRHRGLSKKKKKNGNGGTPHGGGEKKKNPQMA